MKEVSPWRSRRFPPAQERQPEYSYSPEEAEIPLREYWKILVKRRGMILLIFLVIFASGSYFALSATNLYTASATIKIEPQNPKVTGIGELQTFELRGDYDYYQTQFALLASRPLAARVITELGLGSNKAFTEAKVVSPNPVKHVRGWIFRLVRLFTSFIAPLIRFNSSTEESQISVSTTAADKLPIELTVGQDLIAKYLAFLDVSPRPNTRLVKVQFTTPNPALSQVLANAHVQAFMRMSLESRFSLTKEAREFLDQKKSELRQKLEKSEAALNTFRRAHGVLSVEKGENIVVDRLIELNSKLTAARAQRIEAESLYRTVEKRSNQDLAEIMKQGLVQQLKSNIANLEAEKARLGTIFKPDHPRIKELNQQIAAARQAFNSEIANVVRGIKSNYAAALAKEQGLQAEAEKQQRDALRLRELGVDYTLLQEEVNANRTLYESLLKRLSETNVSNDLAVSNMQIAERAAKPLGPSGPNVPLFILASMFSGLMLGVGAAFLREFFDSTLDTPEEVWRSVGLGTLGVVPDLKLLGQHTHNGGQLPRIAQKSPLQLTDRRLPQKDLIINFHPLSIVNESYRTIRTSLLLSQAEKPPQVVLLTSPSPGEGKTATSLNLAISLAQDGHNVLLVDGDMRKGVCHNRLGLRNHRGLSNVLTGGLSLKEAIQQTPVSGLFLLTPGVTPPNPSELLGSRKMAEIINNVRQDFEFILIDSPPMIAISDAAILSVVADGVILVLNGRTTSTAYAQKAVERLDMVRARLLGVILNAVNLNIPHYSYFRKYSTYYDVPNGNQLHTETDEIGVADGESPNGFLSEGLAESGPSKSNEVRGPSRGEETESHHETHRQNPPVSPSGISNSGGSESPSTAKSPNPASDGRSTQSRRLVPQRLMSRLVDVLMESVGPVAPLVVRDHIASMGESYETFPMRRMDELIKRVAPEILHGQLRARFQAKISQELLNFEND